MDLDEEYGDRAWGNFTAALSAANPRLEAAVKALYAPLEVGRVGLSEMLSNRWLDTAVGAQLDGIGQIVGQSRYLEDTVISYFFGFSDQAYTKGFEEARFRDYWEPVAGGTTRLSDDDYRRVLYWKIAVNNGHGTGPELGQAMRGIFNTDFVRVARTGTAKIRVFVGRWNDGSDPILNTAERWIPKAAGVGLEVMLGGIPEETFGFSDQGFAGFEVGRFADTIVG